jgi:hypothetical protein
VAPLLLEDFLLLAGLVVLGLDPVDAIFDPIQALRLAVLRTVFLAEALVLALGFLVVAFGNACFDGIVRLLGLAARLAFAALQVTDFHVLFVFLREPALAALAGASVLLRLASGLASLDICVKEAILGEFLVEVIEDVEVILEVELDSVLDEGGAAVAGAGEAGNGKEREKGDD